MPVDLESLQPMPFSIRDPYAVSGTFRKAQLHCHTTESDGQFTPRDLLHRYKSAGYSFVCITDHNRVTRCDELDDAGFLAVPGSEDTIPHPVRPLGPHLGRLFVDALLRTGSPQGRIDSTVATGGMVSLCHPSWTGNLRTGAWTGEAVHTLKGYQLVEIWNPHSDHREDVRRWEVAVRSRGPNSPVWGAAVDDCHGREQFNRAWIMVKVPDVTRAALRKALVGGAFYASTGPSGEFMADGASVAVTLAEPGRIRFLDGQAVPRIELDGASGRYAVRGDELYVRIEVVSGSGKMWSQPFWIVHAVEPDERNARS
jgi:hypothetical protein